jgi:hypothetical protein
MRSMQQKITEQVEAAAATLGLEAVQTYGAASNLGHWYVQDGLDTRLDIAWRFESSCATLSLRGPAADRAAKTEGAAWPGQVRRIQANPDVWEWKLRWDYADGDHANAIMGLVGVALAPYRTARSYAAEVERLRANARSVSENEAARLLGLVGVALRPEGAPCRSIWQAAAKAAQRAAEAMPQDYDDTMIVAGMAQAFARHA